MTQVLPPIISEVTTTEALQSGAPVHSPKVLSERQKSTVSAFVRAHQSIDDSEPAVDEKNLEDGLAQPQVTSFEQAIAVATRGHDELSVKRPGSSIQKRAYATLFSPDRKFLEADLRLYVESLRSGRKSLVDLSPDLDRSQRALRKWLLIQIQLEESSLDPEIQVLLQSEANHLIADHGDYIRSVMSALQTGLGLQKSRPRLREFIKAYQMLDFQKSGSSTDSNSSELLQIFRAIRNYLEKPDPTAELVELHNNTIATLNREKSQNPPKATSNRQHLILSRINQLRWLINAVSLHQRFLNTCQKAQVGALPRMTDLVEACLQTIIASDIFSGINALVRMAGAVSSGRAGAQNLFITNYNRLILQSDLMRDMYRGPFHRKQVVDHLDKSVKSAGILAISGQMQKNES